jgi:hypothetical protein
MSVLWASLRILSDSVISGGVRPKTTVTGWLPLSTRQGRRSLHH